MSILNYVPFPSRQVEIPEFTTGDYGRELSQGALKWESYPLLSDLVAGKIPGRESATEVTCFLNNIGLGIQFAAAGWAAYDAARRQGVGTMIPDDWLFQNIT